jgi:hypothetical protein
MKRGDKERSTSAALVTADDAADVDAEAMARMMGFSGFDTTSVSMLVCWRRRGELGADGSFSLVLSVQQKHVQDDLAAVDIKQPRTHRQYMNRFVWSSFARRFSSDACSQLTLFAMPCRKGGFNRYNSWIFAFKVRTDDSYLTGRWTRSSNPDVTAPAPPHGRRRLYFSNWEPLGGAIKSVYVERSTKSLLSYRRFSSSTGLGILSLPLSSLVSAFSVSSSLTSNVSLYVLPFQVFF